MDADFIEPDLVLTKDGVLVVNHDVNLRTITDVASRSEFSCRATTRTIEHATETGWFSDDFTLSEFKSLKARQYYPERDQMYNDLLPKVSLSDVLEYAIQINTLRKARGQKLIGVYIETKHPGYFRERLDYDMEELLYEELLRHNLASWKNATEICPIILQSFFPDSLDKLGLLTDLPRILLLLSTVQITPEVIDFAQSRVHGLGPALTQLYHSDLSLTGVIESAHEAGLKVHAYTLKDDDNPFSKPLPELYQVLLSTLDGVFAEFPDTAKMARDSLKGKSTL